MSEVIERRNFKRLLPKLARSSQLAKRELTVARSQDRRMTDDSKP